VSFRGKDAKKAAHRAAVAYKRAACDCSAKSVSLEWHQVPCMGDWVCRNRAGHRALVRVIGPNSAFVMYVVTT
jgi:hypothetical protein